MRRDFAWGALLTALIFAAYLPVWRAGFIWDDDVYITKCVALQSWQGLWDIWFKFGTTEQYYPLTNTTFWIEYHLWGLRPLGYHLDNIALHATSAILLWVLLRRLAVPGAWLGAALFAVHPINVESVAWISERKNTLCGVFYLASLLSACRSWQIDGPNSAASKATTSRCWRLALYWYIVALLSKSAAVGLPCVILLLVWWKRGKLTRFDFTSTAPFFFVGLCSGLLILWVENHVVGQTTMAVSYPWWEHGMVIGQAFWFYLGKLAFPRPSSFVYPKWPHNPAAWWDYLPLLAIIMVAAFLWRRRDTRWRPVFVALAYYAIILAPAGGLFRQYFFRYSFVADHLQYLAGMGPLALVAAAFTLAAESVSDSMHRLAIIGGAIILIVLGALAWNQTLMYRDLETLWRTTIQRNPTCAMAYVNLGTVLRSQGNVSGAQDEYQRALQIDPNEPDAYVDLGEIDLSQRRYADASEQFQRALSIYPRSVAALSNLGVALQMSGQLNEAIHRYNEALAILPTSAEAHYNLGFALARSGRLDEAITHYRQSLQSDPNRADTHAMLANALLKSNRPEEAIPEYRQAIELNPAVSSSHNNLGASLERTGALSDALAEFREALRLTPGDVHAQANIARVEAEMDASSSH